MKIIEIQFDMQTEEIIAYDGDVIKRFNVTQLREVRELFHRYDHANFTHDKDEELDAFHNFCEEMAKYSPEALDVASPFLN